MGYERAAWLGNALLAAVSVFLAWVKVSTELARWATVGIAVVVVFAIVALFPRKRADGSTARLADTFRPQVSGSRNPTMVAGEHSSQIVNEGGGMFHVNTRRDE
ncbi:hypothetical protein [Mycobacterium kubicae]|uniref:hypothetical protein n=1 Tax=Mycobacterium kubicae TaxID=120959 RepID=UPI001041CC99|nr:hypothetical protein [Mycobacterium kubicae]